MADAPLGRLVRAASAGDGEAWRELWHRLQPYVLAVTRARGLSPADAADVAQTCWLRLVEHIGRLDDADRVASWLGTTARRECHALQRRTGRAARFGVTGALEREPAAAPPPDRDLLAGERDGVLRAALARLSPRDQTLLRLRMVDPPVPYAAIEAALGIAKGGIGPSLGRAVGHLRRQLRAQGVDLEQLRP